MKKNDTIATIAVFAAILALTTFLYNYFDQGVLDYRPLIVTLIGLGSAFLFYRGKLI
jgi:hypothetical protein